MIKIFKTLSLFFKVSVFLFLPIEQVKAEWVKHSFDVMGTRSHLEFELPNNSDREEIISLVVDEMNRIDRLMSPFKPSSELSKINRDASKKKIRISKELFNLLEESARFSKLTQGSFDISFSSIGYLYDFRKSIRPTEKQLTNLTKAINFHSIQLDKTKNTVHFANANVKIDLGGIAKGYAVDQSIKLLMQARVKNAYVSAGGDSRIIGKKQDRLWYIGIKHPRMKGKLLANLPLEEVSISTSGDYERFFIKDGVRYHHIIDPKTGDSARSLQSVTILASNSTTADALSTSVFILGRKKGLELINNLTDTSVIIVDAKGKIHFSDDMAQIE